MSVDGGADVEGRGHEQVQEQHSQRFNGRQEISSKLG